MAVIGAFHPLTRVASKVASANTLQTLRFGRGNWSSYPETELVALGALQVQHPLMLLKREGGR